MEPEEISVVIIDDSTVDRLAVTRALGCCDTLQCQTSEYADPDEAVLALESTHADVVLLDYKFPDGKTGLEALIRMQSTRIDAPVIVLTGCGDEELAVEMLKTGAVYQRDDGDAANLGGLGLGLSLCRDLVELHGGRIWATSELGVGSVFFFTLPLSPDVSNEEKQEQVPEWRHEPMEG